MNQEFGESMPHGVVEPEFDVQKAVIRAEKEGYSFSARAITQEACRAMEAEADSLDLQASVQSPLNEGTKREVIQSHERAYRPVNDTEVPIAAFVSRALIRRVRNASPIYPELSVWQPTEAGYQRYRSADDGISPHRDRKSDQLLAATITISGASLIKIYEPIDDPDDYTKLRLVDEFQTQQGSMMLLKAPGLGDGQQTIHEALPPARGNRLVLNLRMRPDVLE
jgi:hypothetical protein